MSDPLPAPPRAAPALLLLAALAVWSSAISPAFQLDDYQVLGDLPRGPAVFLDPVAMARGFGPEALARFVATASLGLDRAVWGRDARGFHATNVAIHLAATLLVALLVRELFRTPRLARSRLAPAAPWIALGAAALFALHPLQTQAVTYVVQRMTSLAVALGLAGLVAWLRARRAEGRARLGWLAAATAATALAMLTKEIAFTFPLLAVAAEVAFLEGPLRRRLLGLAPLVATMAIVPAVVLAGAPVAERLQAGGDAALALVGLDRRAYLLTQAHVVLTYTRLLFWPAGQNLFPDYPLTRALDAGTLAAIAAHALALGAALVVGWRSRERAPERTLVAFGVVWFYVALSVESVAVVIVDVMNEHRVYYPSVGVALAVATASVGAAAALPAGWRRAAAGAGLAVLVTLGAVTVARNRVWRDEVTMWSDVAEKSPALPSAHRMLGAVLLRSGRGPEAVAPLRRAIELSPYYGDAWADLVRAYAAAGAAGRSAHAVAAQRYLAMDAAGALAVWDEALRLSPTDAAIHHGRALALRALGRQAQAEEALAVACRLGAARACSGGGGMVPDP
jgi:tetratricopeptide (TPR) repeat protein